MGILRDLKIVKGQNTKAAKIFESLFPSFLDIDYTKPSEYIKRYWGAYVAIRKDQIKNEQSRRSINGKIFEYIIATLLIREKIYPFFMEARVAFVPNINYDLLLYSKEKGPIALSLKTSLRERYKQADLESIALKYVHRKSQSFLLTLEQDDANEINNKIKYGDVIGLEKAVGVLDNDIDLLIKGLRKFELTESPNINVIESDQIITRELVNQVISTK